MARALAFRPAPLRWQLAAWAATASLFLPVLRLLAPESDIGVHADQAAQWVASGRTSLALPHFLFPALVIGVRAVLPFLDFAGAGIAVVLASQLALVSLLLGLLGGAWPGAARRRGAALACLLLALSLLLVMPVNLLGLPERNLYFGYVSISTHHNPTLVLLKPLALGLFLQALSALAPGPEPRSALRVFGTAALALLSTLAKPSFALAFLPALALFAGVWRLGLRRSVDTRLLGLGIALPCLSVLAWQYLTTYAGAAPPELASRIALAPLAVVRALSPSGLAWKFALSILFPACVYALLPGARRDAALNLAWLTFGAGALLAYGFAEAGPRRMDGNFLWSAQIGLFVLFVASLLAALRRAAALPAPGRDARLRVCAAAYALHLASGLVWYAVQGLHALLPGVPILREWF